MLCTHIVMGMPSILRRGEYFKSLDILMYHRVIYIVEQYPQLGYNV